MRHLTGLGVLVRKERHEYRDNTDETPRKIVAGSDYIESLRGRNLKVYLFGELVTEPVDHPMIRPSINAVAETYDLSVRQPDLASAL